MHGRSSTARVGSLEWEQLGGPPLSAPQRASVLGGAAVVVLAHYCGRLLWETRRRGLLPTRIPAKVDLTRWSPPATPAARAAEERLRDVATPAMVNHSIRTYYFSAIAYELSGSPTPIDREALYVAALLHDVGLFEASPRASDHCFTVAGARAARGLMGGCGWDEARQDRVAAAITSNLNAFVPMETFGAEAHFMRAGGLVEVIAQEWKVHPENLSEILTRYPREGFARDALTHVRREVERHPGGRFACLDPLFPFIVRHSRFSLEGRPP